MECIDYRFIYHRQILFKALFHKDHSSLIDISCSADVHVVKYVGNLLFWACVR